MNSYKLSPANSKAPFFMNGQKVVHWFCVFVLKVGPLHWYEFDPITASKLCEEFFFSYLSCKGSSSRCLTMFDQMSGSSKKMWKKLYFLSQKTAISRFHFHFFIVVK